MGPPGAGKGTISSRLVESFKMEHLSSGDLLRSQMDKGTEAGKAAERFVQEGKLVPDKAMVDLIMGEISTRAVQGRARPRRWLLDGFPRTLGQARELAKQQPVDVVISLDVPRETILGRVRDRWVHVTSGRVYHATYNPPQVRWRDDVTGEPLTQRPDDHPDTVSKRLEQYSCMTQPVLDFYREAGLLKVFAGTESDVIWPQVKQFMEELASS